MPSTLLSPACLASAQRQDAAVLVDIHHAAVHQTAAQFYEPAILHDWSPTPTPTRIERFECMLKASSGVWLVAKQVDQIVGFGVLVPAERLLRGLYVHPTAGRQGVGSQLLRALEEVAVRQGVSQLHVHAALNAIGFYQQRGYQGIATRQHCLPSGKFMYCLDMYKPLGQERVRAFRQPCPVVSPVPSCYNFS
ncbi:MAG: GNAT family N-acetyltransferase [Leptolyngbya sp. BL-A-14]